MLLASPRHTAADLDAWRRAEAFDTALARSQILARKEEQALEVLLKFAAAGPAYVGVSWGKDSVVVAHLAERLARADDVRLPVVWVRREPYDNPDCIAVRDAYLRAFPETLYDEVLLDCEQDGRGNWWVRGDRSDNPKQIGFAEVQRRHGDRYVSGVRGEESGTRKVLMRRSGTASERTCRPIGWWRGEEVFGYLHRHDLPVHPAYACTFGGTLDRKRIRVGGIGGPKGRGFGRLEWELRYYRSEAERFQAGRDR